MCFTIADMAVQQQRLNTNPFSSNPFGQPPPADVGNPFRKFSFEWCIYIGYKNGYCTFQDPLLLGKTNSPSLSKVCLQ